MKRTKPLSLSPAVVFLVMLIGIGGVVLTLEKPVYVQTLPNGVTIELSQLASGKTLVFHHGNFWQRTLFRLFGKNLSPRFTGYGSKFPSNLEEGSIGILFVTRSSNGVAPRPGDRSVLGVDSNSKEIAANLLGEYLLFDTNKMSLNLESFWELPRTAGSTLRIRIFRTHELTNFVEFTVPNPMPLKD